MQTREPEARTPYRRAERRCWNCSTDLVLLGKSLVPHPLAPAPAPLRGGNSVRPLTSARVIANLIAPASTGSRHLVAQRRKPRRCLSGDALHHCFAAQIPAPPSPSPAPTEFKSASAPRSCASALAAVARASASSRRTNNCPFFTWSPSWT